MECTAVSPDRRRDGLDEDRIEASSLAEYDRLTRLTGYAAATLPKGWGRMKAFFSRESCCSIRSYLRGYYHQSASLLGSIARTARRRPCLTRCIPKVS